MPETATLSRTPPTPRLPERNVDSRVLSRFGLEWTRFDQSRLTETERAEQLDAYFEDFPWKRLARDARGFDAGCGSGRWARAVAPRVGRLWCIDASPMALESARGNLYGLENVELAVASLDAMPMEDGSMDFGYCLGVLHHVPDPAAGLASCVRKLKEGAPLALYIRYAVDDRPAWFRALWRVSTMIRWIVCRLPGSVRHCATTPLAALVYFPLARAARSLERAGLDMDSFPLAGYRNRSFYSMRTDSLDRFGTVVEKRFTRAEVRRMMEDAGLERIRFGEGIPYWRAVGYRA